nr:MAG TPA: hypothetical protein [Caudoviricetes sp.]
MMRKILHVDHSFKFYYRPRRSRVSVCRCLAYFTCSRAYYWRFNLPAVVIFNREIDVRQRN